MSTFKNRKKLLVNGYVREFPINSNVHNRIPNEINDLIFSFFFIMIGSEMLTNEDEEQLMEWIDDSMGCDFNLLFKATRDGFGSAEFHKKCDGKGPNISIIKSEKECLFGGYVSKSWDNKNEFSYDDYTWLYSLRNNKGIQKKFKILKEGEEYAMYGDNDGGPCYGWNLFISNNCNKNQDSYTCLSCNYEGGSDSLQLNDGTEYFKVLDYEMWQIVKY